MANTMTELLPGFYSVSVPEEASNFEKIGKELWYYVDGSGSHFNVPIDFDFEFIGVFTADTIDFDCEPYVEVLGCYDGHLLYKSETNPFGEDTPQDSFRSLLTSKGQHFVNPYGEKLLNINAFNGRGGFINGETLTMNSYYKKWQQAEQNLVKKLVIIKKSKVMGKLKVTPGVAILGWVDMHGLNIDTDLTSKKCAVMRAYKNDFISPEEAEANANLYMDAHNTYNKSGLTASELLQQRDELLAQLKASNKLICSLKLSMLAHPDCEDGSEFDDFTGTAQALENSNEYLIQKIENHV